MNKFAIITLLFTISYILISCPQPNYHIYTPPDNFSLLFMVENNMDAPITIKIRNYYNWGDNSVIAYSNWISEDLNGNEVKNISNDITGNFVLLNLPLVAISSNDFISSFEIEVKTPDIILHIAGYSTDEPGFDDTGLCYLHILSGIETDDKSCFLYTKSQVVRFEVDYILPIKLVINEDASFSLMEEIVEEGAGITVFGS
ncbi:MAG: hypothetical protein FWD26_01920 [Treponema sp.]|nr:hypothetical protein [Treponema sp.]